MSACYPLVFSYGDDEFMPVLLGYSHNLKEKNLTQCTFRILSEDDQTLVVQRSGKLFEKDVELKVTLEKTGNGYDRFCSGLMTMDNKDFVVQNYATYSSLQIGNYCYDRIAVVRLKDGCF